MVHSRMMTIWFAFSNPSTTRAWSLLQYRSLYLLFFKWKKRIFQLLSTSCFMTSFCFSDSNEIAIALRCTHIASRQRQIIHPIQVHFIIASIKLSSPWSSWGFLMNKHFSLSRVFGILFQIKGLWEWSHNWYIVVETFFHIPTRTRV